MPEGKFIATVKVGEKRSDSNPKGRARDIFDINPGDTLLMLADKNQGIAIVQNDVYMNFADALFEAQRRAPRGGGGMNALEVAGLKKIMPDSPQCQLQLKRVR